MTVTADQLREAMVQVADLEQRVVKLVDKPIDAKHPVNFDASVSAVFAYGDTSSQTPVWVNGGPDFWCSGVSYAAWFTLGGSTSKLHDLGDGLGYTAVSSAPQRHVFDFRWNMTKMSNARGTLFTYLTAPGSMDSLMSRQALGNQETGRTLRFAPWLIERGDSVFFTIKPIISILGNPYVASKVMVSMTMYGYRDQAERANP